MPNTNNEVIRTTHLCFPNLGTFSLEKATSATESHFKIDFQELHVTANVCL